MSLPVLLIDYENTQPDFAAIPAGQCKIIIVLGPQQTKLPIETVKQLQKFGSDLEYVVCATAAKNACDFHLVYHLARVLHEAPSTRCAVISADTGFDALVAYLLVNGKAVLRTAGLPTALSHLRGPNPSATPQAVEGAIKRLEIHKGKPTTKSALESVLREYVKHNAKQTDTVPGLMKALVDMKFLSLNGQKVVYHQATPSQKPSPAQSGSATT